MLRFPSSLLVAVVLRAAVASPTAASLASPATTLEDNKGVTSGDKSFKRPELAEGDPPATAPTKADPLAPGLWPPPHG